jgi:hypothetical protein
VFHVGAIPAPAEWSVIAQHAPAQVKRVRDRLRRAEGQVRGVQLPTPRWRGPLFAPGAQNLLARPGRQQHRTDVVGERDGGFERRLRTA